MRVIIRTREDLARAKDDLELLRKAWRKALTAKAFTMGEDRLSRQSLRDLESSIEDYEEAIDQYENGISRRRARRIVPTG